MTQSAGGAPPAEPEPVGQRPSEVDHPASAACRRARLVTGLLGAWVWSLATLFPWLEVGLGSPGRALLGLAFPSLLGVGLALDALRSPQRGAPGPRLARLRALAPEISLLVAAPLALVSSIAVREEPSGGEVFGPLHLTVLVVAAGAYLGAAARLTTLHEARRTARSQPLPPSAIAQDARWTSGVRAALLWLVGAGAVLLVTLAPGLESSSRLARDGREGAEVGAVLASVVGLALGVSLLGAFVAPALRARSRAEPALPSRHGAIWLLLALGAAAGWLVLRHLEGAGGP